jgi:hypothetical protein
MDARRRQLLKGAGLVLAYVVGGKTVMLSPAQARAKGMPLDALSSAQNSTLESLAEALVPGSKTAGISHYIDKQLTATTSECLLMLRYLGVAPPFSGFYSAALTAAEKFAHSQFGISSSKLNGEQAELWVQQMASDGVENWQGPPASFFYFVLRADATDVTYGTQQGFAKLGIPYSAHIQPKQDW